jgi:hypothetical protein
MMTHLAYSTIQSERLAWIYIVRVREANSLDLMILGSTIHPEYGKESMRFGVNRPSP